MKGLELPINVLIIIALAVIVLIAMVAFFYPSFFSGSQTVGVESVKSAACQILVTAKNCAVGTNNITIDNFDADQDGGFDSGTDWNWAVAGESECGDITAASTEDDNLAALCKCYYQIRVPAIAEAQCKALCGC